MDLRQVEDYGPFPWRIEEVNADEIVEDPAGRGVLHGLPLLVRKRGALVLEGVANTVFQGGVHQQTNRHHHQ